MGKRPRLRDFFAGHKENPPRTPPYSTEDLMEMALEGETDLPAAPNNGEAQAGEDRVEKALKKLHKAHQRLKDDIEDGKV